MRVRRTSRRKTRRQTRRRVSTKRRNTRRNVSKRRNTRRVITKRRNIRRRNTRKRNTRGDRSNRRRKIYRGGYPEGGEEDKGEATAGAAFLRKRNFAAAREEIESIRKGRKKAYKTGVTQVLAEKKDALAKDLAGTERWSESKQLLDKYNVEANRVQEDFASKRASQMPTAALKTSFDKIQRGMDQSKRDGEAAVLAAEEDGATSSSAEIADFQAARRFKKDVKPDTGVVNAAKDRLEANKYDDTPFGQDALDLDTLTVIFGNVPTQEQMAWRNDTKKKIDARNNPDTQTEEQADPPVADPPRTKIKATMRVTPEPNAIRKSKKKLNAELVTAVMSDSSGFTTWRCLKRGADPNATSTAHPQDSVLNSAAFNGSLECMKVLLEFGADPDLANDYNKQTPLFQAVIADKTDAAIFLLEHGADWRMEDTLKNTALQYGEEDVRLAVKQWINEHPYGPIGPVYSERGEDVLHHKLTEPQNANEIIINGLIDGDHLLDAAINIKSHMESWLIGTSPGLSPGLNFGLTRAQAAKLYNKAFGTGIHPPLVGIIDEELENQGKLKTLGRMAKRRVPGNKKAPRYYYIDTDHNRLLVASDKYTDELNKIFGEGLVVDKETNCALGDVVLEENNRKAWGALGNKMKTLTWRGVQTNVARNSSFNLLETTVTQLRNSQTVSIDGLTFNAEKVHKEFKLLEGLDENSEQINIDGFIEALHKAGAK